MIELAVVLTRRDKISKDDLTTLTEFTIDNRKIDPLNLDDSYKEKMKIFESLMINEALK